MFSKLYNYRFFLRLLIVIPFATLIAGCTIEIKPDMPFSIIYDGESPSCTEEVACNVSATVEIQGGDEQGFNTGLVINIDDVHLSYRFDDANVSNDAVLGELIGDSSQYLEYTLQPSENGEWRLFYSRNLVRDVSPQTMKVSLVYQTEANQHLYDTQGDFVIAESTHLSGTEVISSPLTVPDAIGFINSLTGAPEGQERLSGQTPFLIISDGDLIDPTYRLILFAIDTDGNPLFPPPGFADDIIKRCRECHCYCSRWVS